jgi:hypothetical protein
MNWSHELFCLEVDYFDRKKSWDFSYDTYDTSVWEISLPSHFDGPEATGEVESGYSLWCCPIGR